MWKRITASVTGLALLLLLGSSVLRAQDAPFVPVGWNVNQKKIDSKTVSSQFYAKFANYIDASGKWNSINLSPVAEPGGGFRISKGPFTFIAPKTANGDIQFIDTNRWDIVEKKKKDDLPFAIRKKFIGAAPVDGIVTQEGILYPGAFPANIDADLLLQTDTDELRYLVKWNAAPQVCNGTMEIPFEVTADEGKPFLKDGQPMDDTEQNVRRGLTVGRDAFRGITFRKAGIWDSGSQKKQREIDVMGKVVNGKMIGRKIIPCDFFTGASFPVYSDTTSTFNPAAGAASPVDGRVRNTSNDTWANMHSEALGTSVDVTGTDIYIIGWDLNDTCNGNFEEMMRFTAVFFDTSSIPDTDSVTATTLQMVRSSASSTDGNGNTVAAAVYGSATPATNNLTTDDWEVPGTTAFSDTIAQAAWDGTEIFTFNATGRSNVSKTGVSQFAVRDATYDVPNSAPTCTSQTPNITAIASHTADATGTANDPLLTVTHSAAATSPKPTMFIIISSLLAPLAYAF